MSDDTPTQRFDQQGGDAPTERLATPQTGETGELVQEERKNRRLFIILGIVGGVLLLTVIILLALLLTQNNAHSTGAATSTPSATPSATPTASSTPSATPTPTPTPTSTPTTDPAPPPPPPTNTVKIDKFSGTSTIRCNTQAPVEPDYTLFFEWRTTNAAQIYFGVATADASTGAFFTNLPPNGNSEDDFEYQLEFPCPAASQNYTLTVIGNNGDKVSKSIVVTNNGDKQ